MIGRRETHSADGLDYIAHPLDHQWIVVWRGAKRTPPHRTRELARRNIRGLKKLRPGTQLTLNF